MKSSPHANPLSEIIERWLDSDSDKTMSGAVSSFGDKVIPALIIMMMSVSALPIPTGGISQILVFVSILLAVQMFFGIDRLIFPESWQNRKLSASLEKRGFGLLVKQLKRIEAHSRMRGEWVTKRKSVKKFTALLAFIGILATLLAPPFTGLDTLPALGVVVLMIGYVLSDAVFWIIGSVIMLVGIIFELTVGLLVIKTLKNAVTSHPYISISVVVILGIWLLLKAKSHAKSQR